MYVYNTIKYVFKYKFISIQLNLYSNLYNLYIYINIGK